eukprot:TRINITY_DN90839_c0_g1_i1.p1 TRINITY_DN90839_c0_g1~~TRINITY_DN90839_c0_g1_i1.p1  ORF type:complete len:676 (+),score=97.53 TRINITY_DN90839_c0_g1_i1:97-2124(+)
MTTVEASSSSSPPAGPARAVGTGPGSQPQQQCFQPPPWLAAGEGNHTDAVVRQLQREVEDLRSELRQVKASLAGASLSDRVPRIARGGSAVIRAGHWQRQDSEAEDGEGSAAASVTVSERRSHVRRSPRGLPSFPSAGQDSASSSVWLAGGPYSMGSSIASAVLCSDALAADCSPNLGPAGSPSSGHGSPRSAYRVTAPQQGCDEVAWTVKEEEEREEREGACSGIQAVDTPEVAHQDQSMADEDCNKPKPELADKEIERRLAADEQSAPQPCFQPQLPNQNRSWGAEVARPATLVRAVPVSAAYPPTNASAPSSSFAAGSSEHAPAAAPRGFVLQPASAVGPRAAALLGPRSQPCSRSSSVSGGGSLSPPALRCCEGEASRDKPGAPSATQGTQAQAPQRQVFSPAGTCSGTPPYPATVAVARLPWDRSPRISLGCGFPGAAGGLPCNMAMAGAVVRTRSASLGIRSPSVDGAPGFLAAPLAHAAPAALRRSSSGTHVSQAWAVPRARSVDAMSPHHLANVVNSASSPMHAQGVSLVVRTPRRPGHAFMNAAPAWPGSPQAAANPDAAQLLPAVLRQPSSDAAQLLPGALRQPSSWAPCVAGSSPLPRSSSSTVQVAMLQSSPSRSAAALRSQVSAADSAQGSPLQRPARTFLPSAAMAYKVGTPTIRTGGAAC